MTAFADAQQLCDRLARTQANLTQIRAIAQEIGKDQETARLLWKQGDTRARLLSLLILDLKTTDANAIERMIADIDAAEEPDQRQLCDWLIANVIMKKSALKRTSTTWISEPSIMKRRVFWSVQARSIQGSNREQNSQLLDALEEGMADAEDMVQEVMNWCAAQVGIADEGLRSRCMRLGERLGLYRDYPVSKGCISPYLPIWIESVVGKNAAKKAEDERPSDY